MTYADWIPSIVSTGGLGVIIWLAKNVVVTRLKNAVAHEFNIELERVRDRMTAQRDSVNAMRETLLSVVSSRQSSLGERRVTAGLSLWGTIVDLAPKKALASYIAFMNFEEALKAVEANEKAKQAFSNKQKGTEELFV